jgi:hypothetical protein
MGSNSSITGGVMVSGIVISSSMSISKSLNDGTKSSSVNTDLSVLILLKKFFF